MANTMFDYLVNVTPDYATTTLSINPQVIMPISGMKDVEIHQGRGLSEERIILSNQSKFWIKLQWNALSEDDHSTLFDFYHDVDKGCGIARSFKWTPPTQYDSHVYVVRFDSNLDSFLNNYKNYGIGSLMLYVLGRIAE